MILVLPTWTSPIVQLTLYTKSPRFKEWVCCCNLVSIVYLSSCGAPFESFARWCRFIKISFAHELNIGRASFGTNHIQSAALDCEEAAQSSNAGDKFFLMAASEVDTNIGSAANDVASLAAAAADRLSASNVALSSALQSCNIASESLSQMKANGSSGKSDFAELIAETRKRIAMARRS